MARAGEAGQAGARRSAGPSRAAGGTRPAADAARAHLRRRLEPGLTAAGFDLEDVTVARAGSRSVVRVVVDRDGGIDLDAVAEASRLVSAALDDEDGAAAGGSAGSAGPVAGPYVLEVTSPGVDRPLTEPRHWRRAVGRLVSVRRVDGVEVEGRVLSADAEGADLAVPTAPARRGRPVRRRVERVVFTEVARATVLVEFGSAPDGDTAADATTAADDAIIDADDGDADDETAGIPGAPGGDEVAGGSPAGTGPTGTVGGGVVEDHDAVGAEAGRDGRTGKEMNR